MRRPLTNQELEPLIFKIRGQRVLMDADLVRLYGVETFRRNRHRFPADFAFQLTSAEFGNLRSQIAMSNSQAIEPVRHNSSQFAMSSVRHRGATYRTWAFTRDDT